MNTRLGLILLCVLPLWMGCTNNKEKDDLSLAQACLDGISDSNPQAALGCMQYAQGYSDQQAMILQCSILLTAGGITGTQITKAISAAQSQTGGNSSAVYMAFLAFTAYSTPAAGETAAVAAQPICEQTDDVGLAFVSEIAVTASIVNSLAGGIDLTQPTGTIVTDLQNAAVNCTGASPDPSCAAAVPAITAAANNYCTTGSANESVCTQLTGAETQYANDPAELSQDFYCTIQGKTFTPPTTCT